MNDKVESAGTAEVIAGLTKQYYEAESLEFTAEDGAKAEVLVLPAGKTAHSIQKYVDENRTQPKRRKGQATFFDLKSLIIHINRFKDINSVLFANNDRDKPSLTVVYDYNEAGTYQDAKPRFGEHSGYYAFPLSDEWNIWQANNKKPMSQYDFAVFIENNLSDIISPQDDITSDKIKEFAELLGGTFASPSRLVALSKGLEINEGNKCKQDVNLSTGEKTLYFTSEHTDAAGAPIKIPNLFMIAIPVFVAGSLYQIAVRLRYRLSGNTATWFYELYRDDKVFEHAFDEAAKNASDATVLTLFVGAPEK